MRTSHSTFYLPRSDAIGLQKRSSSTRISQPFKLPIKWPPKSTVSSVIAPVRYDD